MSFLWLPQAVVSTDERDRHYLKIAYTNAAQMGTDPNTQNGSLLINANGCEVDAANHFPYGVHETDERWERPAKYDYVEHAERNAIYAAAHAGISTDMAELFCPWYACVDCARAIIQSGIRRVIGHSYPFENTPDRWRDNIIKAFDIMNEGGVECCVYVGRIFDPEDISAVQVRMFDSVVVP